MTDEQLQTDLEAAVRNLDSRIRSIPPNSHSAAQARRFLDGLDRPGLYPTVAEKLAAVKGAARDLTLDLKSGVDVVRHSPNLSAETNPRPTRRRG